MSLFQKQQHYVALTAFYALSLNEFYMEPHIHASSEIMYVTKGSCRIQVEKESFTLTENQFIFLDENVEHKLFIEPAHPCSILNLEFTCTAVPTSIDIAEALIRCTALADFCHTKRAYAISVDHRNLGYALKDLIFHLQSDRADEEYLIQLLFLRFIIELSEVFGQSEKTTGMYYLKKAQEYIQNNLTETLKVPDIAHYAGINKSYLQSLFSQHLNCTITDYINRRRLTQAAFLLINSSMSVTDIAFQTGYNSRQHFGHTFEKFYGTSPLKYRQLHGKDIAVEACSWGRNLP